MMSQRTKCLWVGFFVLWLFFTLGTFFAVQKPFAASNLLAAGRAALDLLVAGWLALLALAIGDWILQKLLRLNLWLAETLVVGAGLGLGVLGLLSLALGLAGLFRPVVTYGITIGLSLIFGPQALGLFRRCRQWRPANRPNLPVTLYLSIMATLTLLVALLPPTDWDGLFYHLTGPKLYLQAGQIVGGVDIPHLNFPGLMEMLFTWAILLRSDIAAKLLHTFFGLLLAGLVYLIARRFLGQKSAWLAVLVLASMPMINTLAGWAYNDLALAFYQLAGLYALIRYHELERTANNHQPPDSLSPEFSRRAASHRWLILSGILAGLAMGLKYTSFIAPLVIGGLILWHAYRPARFTTCLPRLAGLRAFAIFALVALLVALPWYAKNWVFSGNPVYPFLAGLFGGQYWDGFRADWYASAGTGIGFQPGTLLILPWLLTLGLRDMNYWDGRTGPLFLLFLPLILFYTFFRPGHNTSRRPVALTALLIFALAQFGFWTLGVIWSRSLWQSRLLLPGLAALAPVAGRVWADLAYFDLPSFSLNRFVNLAIGLTLALTVVDVGLLTLQINPVPYLAGLESRDEYLNRRLGTYYAAMQQINHQLPSQAVILFLWEPRSYYCQRDCRPDSILDEFPHQVYQHGTAPAIAAAWRREGVSHTLIHRAGLRFVLNESPEKINADVLSELEACCLREEFEVGSSYQVYALEGPR